LIDHLSADFDVYVHTDKKSKLTLANTKASFIKRTKVYWGSYNQIKATLELFKTAYLKKYDRYILISGQDMPIKTNKDIISFFESYPDKQFLEYNPLPIKWWNSEGGLERIKYYYFKSNSKFIGKVFGKLTHWIKRLKFTHRKIDKQYYGGANWTNLNGNAVELILDYISKNPGYLKRFKFTNCADELFFQTILLNSSLAQTCENDTLRYFNWSKGPEYPRTLRKDDLEDIQHSKALFARKFDETVDKEIISLMYEHLKK
jgi:Core-2/I-Branching enzyme